MNVDQFITESPIERRLLAVLLDKLLSGVNVRTQFAVLCASGRRYRLDIHLDAGGRCVCVECDGRDFHDFREDSHRDADLLQSGIVSEIFRFKGTDICFDTVACVAEVERMLPFLFYATAKPLDHESKSLASSAWRDLPIQPIHRSMMDGRMVEYRAADWRETAKGPRVWSIANILDTFGAGDQP